jgi:hypothetical protein
MKMAGSRGGSDMDAFEAISLSGSSSVMGKKLFSVAEANRSLTLVKRVVSDIVDDYKKLRSLHEQCRLLEAKGRANEVGKVRQKYAFVNDHLAELNEELEKIGCEIKDYHIGLVDFPSLLEGREIYLCWRLGEKQVEHWHPVDEGYTGRRPITELYDPA